MANGAPLRHLVWTLSKDDIHQILAHIERFKSRLILALQKDSMKLSRAIKTDTAAIEPLGIRVQNISTNIDSLSASMSAQANSTLLDKVLSWLSPVDCRKDHNGATEARVEGTGQWFLSSPNFVRWRDGAKETLFCPVRHSFDRVFAVVIHETYIERSCFSDVAHETVLFLDVDMLTLNSLRGSLAQARLSLHLS